MPSGQAMAVGVTTLLYFMFALQYAEWQSFLTGFERNLIEYFELEFIQS